MRYGLRTFQELATADLLRRLNLARQELTLGGDPQTIVFSAPTASGKTVMMAAMMEAILVGGEVANDAAVLPVPSTTFLWLSDSPDLNAQSRRRLLDASDGLIPERLVMIENDFDQPVFDSARVYFLNYGKLSVASLLTRPGNNRQWTIWETIQNTALSSRQNFVVIVDEAHYGLKRNRETNQLAATIPQRFLVGAEGLIRPNGGSLPTARLLPLPLIVGVSATPERLAAFLQGQAGTRTTRQLDVPPSAVRASGLIKDRIVLYNPAGTQNEWTMLAQACRQLTIVEKAWNQHANAQQTDPVIPVLLVQVNNAVSTTFLAECLQQMTGEGGLTLRGGEVVHCFGEGLELQAGNWRIARVEPNDIAGDRTIRVVFFKTALTTGWDCPRAEILMSFRAADDSTSIAQLVGRMVRTPLAVRIVGDETLNEVYLYLPNFDQETVAQIKDRLTGQRDNGAAEVVGSNSIIALQARPGFADVLDQLRQLPSEHVAENRPMPEIRRLFKLARLLERDGLSVEQEATETAWLIAICKQWLSKRREENPELDTTIQQLGQVDINAVVFEGEQESVRGQYITEASDVDVQRRFRIAAQQLAQELGEAWLTEEFRGDKPRWCMLEFTWLARSVELRGLLNAAVEDRFAELIRANESAIRRLSAEQATGYRSLQQAGRNVQLAMLLPEERVVYPLPKDASGVAGHLYVEEADLETFRCKLNPWELKVIEKERNRPEFVTWLRNLDRKPWSLSYSYLSGGSAKPGFPDFLVFRREADGSLITDILEPHAIQADSVAKAKGLANFANVYGDRFGRIDMILVDAETIISLPFKDMRVRKLVLNDVQTTEQLQACFRSPLTVREAVVTA